MTPAPGPAMTPPHNSADPIDLCEDASNAGAPDDSDDDTRFGAGPCQTMKSAVPTGFASADSSAGCGSSRDHAAEKQALLDIKTTPIEPGDNCYVVPSKWLGAWKNYAEHGGSGHIDPPGAIDFDTILDNDGELQKGLHKGYDYELVPEEPWQHLKERYTDGSEIVRRCMKPGTVAVYPHVIRVLRVGDPGCEAERIRIYAWEMLCDLKQRACSVLGIREADNPRLCEILPKVDADDDDDGEQEEANDLAVSLEDAAIVNGAIFVVKTDSDSQESLGESHEPSPKKPKLDSPSSMHDSPSPMEQPSSSGPGSSISGVGDPSPAMCRSVDQPSSPLRAQNRLGGLFGRASPNHGDSTPNAASYRYATTGISASSSTYDYDSTPARDDTIPGKCGLNNLGNTCFMSSGLQCLIHTDEICDFFSKDFEKEINEDNVLGCKGQMAREYGSLVQKVHSGQFASIAPRSFKRCLAEFAPQFSGYEQHDSQECLNSLLDGLHEDLNRCKEKPATEIPEANGRPDDEVAREAWEVHKKRNNSVILDTFGAQFKSTVKCPDCPRVSVTFDPYMMMSIPLPVTEKTVSITMVFDKGRQQAQKIAVKGNRAGAVREFLSKRFEISVDHIVICEVFNNKVWNIVEQDSDDDFLATTDIWMAYEVGAKLPDGETNSSNAYGPRYNAPSRQDSEVTTVKINQKVPGGRKKSSMGYSYNGSVADECIGSPLVLRDAKETLTVSRVTEHVKAQLKTMLREELEHWHQRRPNDEDLSAVDDNPDPPFTLQFPSNKPDVDLTSRGKYWEQRLTDFDQQELEILWNRKFYSQYIAVECDEPQSAAVCSCRSCFIETAVEELQTEANEDSIGKGRREDGKIHLEDCIELMTAEETLGEENTWYCSACKDHKQASKTLELWSAPEVLIVHLKRFSYTRSSRQKVDEEVIFPLTGLDLSTHVLRPNGRTPIYDLYAVSNHIGGYGGGHYTAFAKNGDRWVEFDDAMARDIDESTVQSPAAYMLFYRRRNPADSGAAARTIPEVLSTETGEAGVVANMSARPRENMAGRGRVGPCDFGGAADLELLSGTDRDSSPVEACATRHEVAANLGSQEC